MKIDASGVEKRFVEFAAKILRDTGELPEIVDVEASLDEEARTVVMVFHCAGGIVYYDWMEIELPFELELDPRKVN